MQLETSQSNRSGVRATSALASLILVPWPRALSRLSVVPVNTLSPLVSLVLLRSVTPFFSFKLGVVVFAFLTVWAHVFPALAASASFPTHWNIRRNRRCRLWDRFSWHDMDRSVMPFNSWFVCRNRNRTWSISLKLYSAAAADWGGSRWSNAIWGGRRIHHDGLHALGNRALKLAQKKISFCPEGAIWKNSGGKRGEVTKIRKKKIER